MNRDLSIDILRFIALSSIILVHISPSLFLVQLRNFDVPLMVLLSGVSYSMSSGVGMKYSSYCWKRFKRLVLPVWFYLPIYFIGCYIFSHALPSLYQIISYYTLMTGWYVWIIRVFFIIALVAPFAYWCVKRMGDKIFIVMIFLLLLLFEGFMNTSFSIFRGSVYFLTNIPYVLIFAIGCKLHSFSKKESFIMALCCFGIYILMAYYYYYMNGEYILTQVKKYPPQLYYTSYALMCCFLLWTIREKIVKILPLKLKQLCAYIGSHTIWVYLWHIPIISIVENVDSTILRYMIVYLLSLGITFVQNMLIDKIVVNIGNESIKKNINMIFKG